MNKIIMQDHKAILKGVNFNPLKNKTILIVGANGFIGSYMIQMLHLINIINDLKIKIVAISKNKPIAELKEIFKENYKFYSEDLSEMTVLDKIHKVDYIIHCAGYAQPSKFLSNPIECIKLNSFLTDALLQKTHNDCARFLFLSSSDIYGNPDNKNIPTKEDYPGFCSPIIPRAAYSESKRLGETLCYFYKNVKSTNVVIARLSIVYGPGISIYDERVLGNFIKMALVDREIKLLDKGDQVRTFCYISDAIIMILNILLYGKNFVYNVGGRDQFTIKELAEKICNLTHSKLIKPKSKFNLSEQKRGFNHVELDISKVCNEFNLREFVIIEKGLIQTINWNLEKYKNNNLFKKIVYEEIKHDLEITRKCSRRR